MTTRKPNVPIIIDAPNQTNRPRILELTSNSEVILPSTTNFEVCVHKLEVPLAGNPINIITVPYKIILWKEDKSISDAPLLPREINNFTISGPIYSEQEFIDKVNEIIQKKPAPYNLGSFSLVDRKLIFTIHDAAEAANHNKIYIYLDARLRKLFDGFKYQEEEFSDDLYYRLIVDPATSGKIEYKQTKSSIHRFTKIKSIRVYSDLPTEPFIVVDQQLQAFVRTNMLTEITYNAVEVEDSDNLLYFPSIPRYYTLGPNDSVKNVKVWMDLHYYNDQNVRVIIEPEEYASITLGFQERG